MTRVGHATWFICLWRHVINWCWSQRVTTGAGLEWLWLIWLQTRHEMMARRGSNYLCCVKTLSFWISNILIFNWVITSEPVAAEHWTFSWPGRFWRHFNHFNVNLSVSKYPGGHERASLTQFLDTIWTTGDIMFSTQSLLITSDNCQPRQPDTRH